MLELLQYGFMQRAIMAIVAMSLFAPILGIFLILRRQSLLSDTLSHVSLAGVAFGLLLGANTSWMTLVVVTIAAVLMEYLRTVYKDYMEVATAILMSFGLALALIVTSYSNGGSTVSLEQYLFGSVITIATDQVWGLVAIAIVILVLVALFIRPMYILTFDEDTAFVDGLPVRLMSIAFNVVTGVAIALMIPAAGALLVSTIMILPASIAMRIGRSFRVTIFLAVLIGFVGMLSGIIISYYSETPASATITMIFIGIFVGVTVLQKVLKR